MPYQARSQSLYGNVGGPMAPRGPQVDVPGAIDALTGGAASLIHATMLRKQNEAAINAANEQRDYERQKDATDLAFKQQEARRKFITEGGVPGHEQMTPTPTMAQVTMPQSPIARAMTPTPAAPPTTVDAMGNVTGSAGTPTITPTAPPVAPTTAPLPASTQKMTGVPDTYDPTKAAAYIRATETARIRGETLAEVEAEKERSRQDLATQRISAGQDAAVVAQRGRIELEKLRQQRTTGIRRGMTTNAASNVAEKVAEGVISAHGGDRQAAYEWLQGDDPEAVKLRAFEKGDDKSPGLPLPWGSYLDNAAAKYAKTSTSQTLSFQHGLGGDTPEQAKKRVDTTRRLITNRPAAAQVPPKGAESMAPISPTSSSPFQITRPAAPAAAPAAPASAQPAAQPAVKAPIANKDTVPDEAFTDDEIDKALDAGKESDTDVRKFILDLRKKKKPAAKR